MCIPAGQILRTGPLTDVEHFALLTIAYKTVSRPPSLPLTALLREQLLHLVVPPSSLPRSLFPCSNLCFSDVQPTCCCWTESLSTKRTHTHRKKYSKQNQAKKTKKKQASHCSANLFVRQPAGVLPWSPAWRAMKGRFSYLLHVSSEAAASLCSRSSGRRPARREGSFKT